MAVDWLPEPGETLDERYELGDQIGVGPTGAVYAAKRLQDGKEVVLKVFHPELFGGQVRGPNTMRLQRARLMKAQGLVTLEEIDVREGAAFVVMPRIESPTLPVWIEAHGAPGIERAIELVQAVGETLEVIHQLGVHGDVKPSNIYVSDAGEILVSDPWFLEGLSGIRDAAGLAPRADAWLAPEQSEGTWQERPETDIYRLAMLMGWLLAQELVEAGSSLVEQGVSCPEGIDQVFLRATQMDPGERFGQVRDFLDALSEVSLAAEDSAEEPIVLSVGEENAVDPLAETIGQGVESPLGRGEGSPGGAEFLSTQSPVDLSDDVADETIEDVDLEQNAQEAAAVDGDGGDEDEDPAATRVLRQDALDTEKEEAEEPETAPADPQDSPASESNHEELVTAEEEAPPEPEPEVEQPSDGSAGERPDEDRHPTKVEASVVSEPQRYATVRDLPGAVAPDRAEPSQEDVPEAEDRGDPLTSTRKHVAPELDPNWRTNPIMVIGPGMLVLSLFVALLVLDSVQDRRQSAAAISHLPGERSEAAGGARDTFTPKQQPSPQTRGTVAPGAPAVGEEMGSGQGAGSAKLVQEPPTGKATPEQPSAPEDAGKEADSTSVAADDYRSLKCPPNMIRVRRTKKKKRGAKKSEMEVWCIDRYEFPGKGRTPRTGIGVVKAERLCAERGHRLCTRREWGVACGGKYPYKGEFDPDACNSAAPGPTPRSVKPAGSKLRCVSGWGAYDMVGNVAEWTSEGKVNGGGARGDAEGGTCYRSIPRKSGGSDVGFRCCVEPSRTEPEK